MILSLNSSTDACNPRMLSPLTLAFIGDTVYDLFVRELLITQANRPANALHKLAVERVRASAQAHAARVLIEQEYLTEEEITILKRGRNAHPGHTPKNADGGDYHLATGLETLFGYLYLKGEAERLKDVFEKICTIFDEEQSKT